MLDLTFRSAEPGDVGGLQTLAEDSPGAPQWALATWLGVLACCAETEQRAVIVAEHLGEAVGFGVVGLAGDDAELESLAVRAGWRRQQVGSRLCGEMVAWGRTRGAERAVLEVRVSNTAARALYHSLGFEERGIRRRYYREPDEDAVVMSRRL